LTEFPPRPILSPKSSIDALFREKPLPSPEAAELPSKGSCGDRAPLIMNCAAILFDMDGTVVDSTAVIERAWTGWAAKHGLRAADILRFSHGRPMLATMDHFRPGRDHSADIAELNRFEETELEGIKAVPGAEAVLSAVVEGPWAIVTSARRT